MRAQSERMLHEMDVVQREEFEAVKAMAEKARAENERLEARIAALEAQLARAQGRRVSWSTAKRAPPTCPLRRAFQHRASLWYHARIRALCSSLCPWTMLTLTCDSHGPLFSSRRSVGFSSALLYRVAFLR